jgi:DNA-binding MarR family transcriptional regulator
VAPLRRAVQIRGRIWGRPAQRAPAARTQYHRSRSVNAGGFEAGRNEFAVFQYPGPNGLRPSDLARRANLSKQAMNYMLAGLESRGYLPRDATPGQRASYVRLTVRGEALMAQFRTTMVRIEGEWLAHLGAERFGVLTETLNDLAVWLGKLPSR